MEEQVKALDRYLKPIDVWAIAFGCMVGWGVFAMPGSTFLPVAGPLGTLFAFIIGTAIMLIIGSNFSFLMDRSSITGGVYSYAKEAFGRDHAFICSWFLCLSYLTIVFLNGTALFIVVRTLFGDSMQHGLHYQIAGNDIYMGETAISVLILAVVGIVIVLAKPLIQKLNTVLAVTLFAGIVIITLVCLPKAFSTGALLSFGTEDFNSVYAIASIVILAPWAFVGFETTSFDTAHFDFKTGKAKRLIVISIIATGFAYAAMALVSVVLVPDGFSSWQEYIGALDSMNGIESVPAFYVTNTILGTPGLVIMTITALAAILTGIIGGYRATTRVLSTMAEDRILSDFFSKTTYSVLFIMVISIVISMFGRNTLEWFIDLTSFGAIVGFGYTSAAAYKLAKISGNKKIKATGITGTVISAVFVIVQIVPKLAAMEAMSSEAFLLLAIWCLIGFAFYWRTVIRSTLAEYSGMSKSGVVLFGLLTYSSLMWFCMTLSESESIDQTKSLIVSCGTVTLLLIFAGLIIMVHVQNIVRQKHEDIEREKIRAVESSLAKSRFLFNMSHDIRTPMNAIIGYTNLALEAEPSPEIRSFLEKIDGSSKHLLELINDILEMSRIESGKIELELSPIDITSVFEDIRVLFTEQMKEKDMDYQVHTGQVRNRYVWCDRKNLNRILLNLISNAYKFTNAGGTITASIWEISTGDSGYGSYELRIKDSGIGMSKEFAERMFNAFERERTSTNSGVEGTGLGLSITKNIVDLMGGTIEVMTAPGTGTEIIIRLRLKLADKEEVVKDKGSDESKTEKHAVDFSNKRLLLVEDNAVNMEIAKMILTQHGFTIETAENGQIAVDMVKEADAGYYDAVLMDIQMPVMDGYEATRTIRAFKDKDKASVPILPMVIFQRQRLLIY